MENFLNERNHNGSYTPFDQENEEPIVLSYVNNVTLILGIIFGMGMLLNVVSIIAIIKSKKIEPITLLILNLSLADMLYIAGICQAFF